MGLRLKVGALISEGRSAKVSSRRSRGRYCVSPLYKKIKVYPIPVIPSDSQRGFYFPPAAGKDRAVNSMEIKDFIILWITANDDKLLSSFPLSLQRGKYVISFYFPLFKQSGINYPPTSSVPLSFKKGASFFMLSFAPTYKN